jgi:hypothetical protein
LKIEVDTSRDDQQVGTTDRQIQQSNKNKHDKIPGLQTALILVGLDIDRQGFCWWLSGAEATSKKGRL